MSAQDTVFSQKIEQIFDQKASPLVMGILNVTPDSFFDGGKYILEADWLAQAEKMIAQGVDIIDIGAYSTRPGAKDISVNEELQRLIKVVISIRNKFPEVLISVDTFRAAVAERAIAAGANIINDISGGTMDKGMFETVNKLQVPYVLMHIKGTPQTMQGDPIYENVVSEVFESLRLGLEELTKLGVKQVIIDPGFGFGKTVDHNFDLLRKLDVFAKLNAPVLVGFSRKSMINKLLNISSKESINGTSILNTLALEKGARILRVHDVKEAKEVITILSKIKNENT